MSPTSRWSRKRTPLTTRPSFTSRQGMILRAGIERLRESDPAFPEGLADDRARGPKAAKVVQRRDPARGLDREVGKPSSRFLEELEIGTGKHAVAADVGEEEVARLGVERGDVPEASAAILGPAGRGDGRDAADQADVEGEGDPVAPELLQEAMDE